MDYSPTLVPQISISPAPPQDIPAEPYSPFTSTFSSDDDDGFRPRLLTPPPSHTRFNKQLSPLRPAEKHASGKGLEQDRFELLLQMSRERSSSTKAQKEVSLRKEIALKAHKNKQAERRALFLSKVLAPPSPTATTTPKTPPDSPAIFHYTLPSPGLVSPLALFESLGDNNNSGNPKSSCDSWVEQVDFRSVKPKPQTACDNSLQYHPWHALPSLDQISARLNPQGGVLAGRVEQTSVAAPRPRLSIGVGRLQLPLTRGKSEQIAPKSPLPEHLLPSLHITTTVVPRTATVSPTKLSESNLLALDSRERRGRTMVSTLRRRIVPSEYAPPITIEEMEDDRKLRWKRHSAPADLMPLRERSGFEHPVLALPGGF